MLDDQRSGVMSTNTSKEEWVPAKKKKRASRHVFKYWQFYVMLLIPIIYYVVFRYMPMFGNIIAFRKYKAGGSIFGSKFSGLRYFKQFIGDKSFWRAFRNTLTLNFTYLLFRFPALHFDGYRLRCRKRDAGNNRPDQ